mgnify:CR=1 FL=1
MKKLLTTILASIVTLSITGCNKNNSSSSNVSLSSINIESSNTLPSEDNKVHLVILAGQSGGRGKALVNDLTEEQKEINTEVDIIADGLVMEALDSIPESFDENIYIDTLGPGLGDFPSEFGPELGIGETLRSRYPKNGEDYKSVIIKYTACGSTFTDHWYSSSSYNNELIKDYLDLTQARKDKYNNIVGPLTNNLYQLIDYTKESLEIDGYEVVIDGITFVHGEQDAKYDDNMEIYEKALTNFIKDIRSYLNIEDLPFIVTEALTNSAKYSNKLREIQRKVTSNIDNTSLVKTMDLYTNTFEPWHFGAQSNMILGNRIAAEIVSLNDTRIVSSINQSTIDVPYGVDVELPKYLSATFDNGYDGYIKVERYTSLYNKNILGEQEVKFIVNTKNGEVEKSYKVNVSNDVAYIDGFFNEYATKKILPNGLGELSIKQSTKGLYFGVKIKDNQIWTDGENWSKGDMGQKGNNDDFRIYLTISDASERMTICLSSANLLRVYDKGISLNDNDYVLETNNLYYNKKINDFNYLVTTNGLVNDSDAESKGMSMELYISYDDLGIYDPSLIKLCFNYNNISNDNGIRTSLDNYLVKTNGDETLNENYFSINELI